jgi:hypothetical protein
LVLVTNRQARFEFARFARPSILSSMDSNSQNSAKSPITKIEQCCRLDLNLESDNLRQKKQDSAQELRISMPLSEADRRILVQHEPRTRDRLAGHGGKPPNNDEFCCSAPEFVLVFISCKLRKV